LSIDSPALEARARGIDRAQGRWQSVVSRGTSFAGGERHAQQDFGRRCGRCDGFVGISPGHRHRDAVRKQSVHRLFEDRRRSHPVDERTDRQEHPHLSGQAWDLCSGNTFTGCKRFSHSIEAMVMTVRSARPVAPPIPASASVAAGPVSGSGASLRGFASEFFVMPDSGGRRIEVAAKVGALQQQATQFCRSHGWRSSVHEREQTIGGHSYLADVLCADDP
jgi:hypothetical protein